MLISDIFNAPFENFQVLKILKVDSGRIATLMIFIKVFIFTNLELFIEKYVHTKLCQFIY